MSYDIRTLRRYVASAAQPEVQRADERPQPPDDLDVLLLGVGNSGEAVALRCQALGFNDGVFYHAAGLNNDRLGPRAVPVRRPDGSAGSLELDERLVMDGDNPRDRLYDYPLLERRYRTLLRGIPVFETHPRAGAGGNGHPVISALDIDLHIDAVQSWLRRSLHQLQGNPTDTAGQSDLQRLLAYQRRRREGVRQKRIIVVGGASGAMGNAAHQLLPYMIRQLLSEQGSGECELWGVLLGPRAFTGLTPFVRHNYRALLEAIEHQSRHGQRRSYINDLEIAMQQPPYDRVFLLDDPALPGEGRRVREAELEAFLDRAALSLSLLLRGTVWPTVASRIANDDGTPREDGKLRYLHSVQGVLIGADRAHLTTLLAAELAARALDHYIRRFEGSAAH